MTPSQILKVLSQGHDRWPGEALEAASAQRSEVGALLLEKLARSSRGDREDRGGRITKGRA